MSNKFNIFKTAFRFLLPKFSVILRENIKKVMEKDNLAKVYAEMQESGCTTVDDLIKWMQAAKIIDHTLLTERRIRQMFGTIYKEVQVDLEEFQTVIERMSSENWKLVEDVLANEVPTLIQALVDAADAFKETNINKKDL